MLQVAAQAAGSAAAADAAAARLADGSGIQGTRFEGCDVRAWGARVLGLGMGIKVSQVLQLLPVSPPDSGTGKFEKGCVTEHRPALFSRSFTLLYP